MEPVHEPGMLMDRVEKHDKLNRSHNYFPNLSMQGLRDHAFMQLMNPFSQTVLEMDT
jgi:hypothetical protein